MGCCASREPTPMESNIADSRSAVDAFARDVDLSKLTDTERAILKGAAADASLSSVSQVGQRGTSIHMAQTRCGGAFTLTLWRNSALVPWAIACWVEVSGVVAVVEFMVGEVVLDVHAVSEANVTALAKKQ